METTEKIERRGWEESPRHEYTKRGTGNAALTLGIIGTAGAGLLGLAALGRGGSMFGGQNPEPAAGTTPTAFEVYEKECAGMLALTNEMWGLKVGTMTSQYENRQVDQAEKFSIWKGQVDADFSLYKGYRDMGDNIMAQMNQAAFGLYKSQRDGMDEVNARISRLEKEVAVNSAVRPYQDKLIQCEINARYTDALNYTNQKTCKAIYGEVVLPSTPVVTGYGSYTACSSAAS